MTAPKQPWDMIPGETSLAHQAFVQYIEMGPARSLRKQADRPDRVAGFDSLRTWSAEWRWQERCRAWDAEQHRIQLEEHAERVQKMNEQHAALGQQAVGVAAGVLTHLVEVVREDPTKVTTKEAIALGEFGVRLQRLAEGEAGERVQIDAGPIQQPVASGQLWNLIKQNPHLADAARMLREAVDSTALGAPAEEPDDSEVVDAEIVED